MVVRENFFDVKPVKTNGGIYWPAANDAGEPFKLVWFNDIQPVLEAKDFVQGLLTEQSAIVVYGQSNSGKTFWFTDLALHIVAGIPWNGRRVDQGGVVYCVLEGGSGFHNRIAAWKEETGYGGYDLPFVAIPSSMNLLSPDGDVDRLIDTIMLAASQMKVPVKLVVIDTLARAFAGGNENASEDMNLLVTNMDKIRQRTQSAVAFVHHSGKDQAKGARGHSSLRAAIDTEIEVVDTEIGGVRTATVVKQRDLESGATFQFSLKVIEVGQNKHGEAVTTCVVDYDNAQPLIAAPRRALKGHNKRAFEVLTDLCGASGQSGHVGVPSGALSVPEQWWRDRFYDRAMPGDSDDAKQKAFRRAADALIADHLVGMSNRRVWVVQHKANQDA